jgi:hypothetical protein
MASDFLFESAPHQLTFAFDQDVSAGLGTSDLVLENLTTGTLISSTDLSLDYDPSTNTATFSYIGAGGGVAGVLPDGNYRATLLGSGITNPAGTPMAADHEFDFFFLTGDANHDRSVNITDLGLLATNWQATGKTFSQGDFNYDSVVDITDLGILATNWQITLPTARPAASDGSNRVRRDRLVDTLDRRPD